MDDLGSPLAALVGAVVCGSLGLLVPRLVARVPEPDDPEPGKPPYAVLAATPRLAPASALASALLGALVGAAVGDGSGGPDVGWWALPVWWVLVPVGVALAFVDWHTLLLPSWLTARLYLAVVPLVVLGSLAAGEPDDLVRALLGWAVAGGVFWLLWLVHPRGMGYGDVRLSGVLGTALGQLGWAELLVGVYAGFLIGGLVGGVLAIARVVDRRGFPFGPFMLAGAVVGVVAGPALGGLAA